MKYRELFTDGKRFHSRPYGPRVSENKHQVFAVGLEHIAECETEEVAQMVCDALNAVPCDAEGVPNQTMNPDETFPREYRACPSCNKAMQRAMERELLDWGEHPGTGTFVQVWYCEPCHYALETPSRTKKENINPTNPAPVTQ